VALLKGDERMKRKKLLILATVLLAAALLALTGSLVQSQVSDDTYQAEASVYWDDPEVVTGYITLSTAIDEVDGVPVAWYVLLGDDVIYSQPITEGTTLLPIPEYRLRYTWQIRQGGEVLDTQLFTTEVGAADAVSEGLYAGPFGTQWATDAYSGLVNVLFKMEWVADDFGVDWPSVMGVCPGKVQDPETGFCYWGVFAGGQRVLYLPIVVKN